MKLETGKPTLDGRYLVYVPGVLGWLEPKIVLWQKGKWTFTFSTEELPDTVISWIGPLPVLKFEWAEKRGEETQFPDEPRGVIDALGDYVPPQDFDL